MANPPKQKGTGGEREVMRLLIDRFGDNDAVRRMPAGARYDIAVRGNTGRVIEALATRPDNGTWLVTLSLSDFTHMLWHGGDASHIEVKRYKRFAHHTLFENEFPR